MKNVSDEKRNTCEGKLTVNECYNILSTFKNNKTPGNDGLTIEFYKAFWLLLGNQLVDALNYSYEHGQLSTSQRQAVITLLEKKDKDKRFIKNWRPISLINVETKIGSKALCKRLEKVLPDIIHYNQNAFVQGRSIFDAIRTIDDIMEYTKIMKLSGFLITIDFEKAFDSVNHSFLIKTLEAFNFGPSFIRWACGLNCNLMSCIMNNGFSTEPTFLFHEACVRATHFHHTFF